MEIIRYQDKYKNDFIQLNLAWIERFYKVEQSDIDVLEHVDEHIQNGAMVYFAIQDETVLATCMIEPHKDNVWEICKLASAGQYTGTGAGSAVFEACINYAAENGAKKILLVTGSILKPALHIYQKYGFKEIPLNKEEWPYERAELVFEKIIK